MTPLPETLRKAHSVAALRTLAQQALPKPLFDFIDGAAEDEWTLRANEASFDDWAVLPRPLEGAAQRDLSLTLFGQRLASPVLVPRKPAPRVLPSRRRITTCRSMRSSSGPEIRPQ